jgi:hypothetical protein
MTYRFDPELAAAVPMLAAPAQTDLAQVRALLAEFRRSSPTDTTGVDVQDLRIPGPPDAPEVAVRVYRPASQSDLTAALLNIHGRGFGVYVDVLEDVRHGTARSMDGILTRLRAPEDVTHRDGRTKRQRARDR